MLIFGNGGIKQYQKVVFRSYHDEPTASHQNCEVKHRWAGSVLLLGTKWESPVLKGNTFCFLFSHQLQTCMINILYTL